MSNDILVLAEHKEGNPALITLQLLGKGRELADKLGVQLMAVVLGYKAEAVTGALVEMGVDGVLVADHPCLQDYNPEVYCRVMNDVVRDTKPRLLLMGYTFLGMELGPAVAASLGVTLVSNCVDLELRDGTFSATRTVYNGVAHIKVEPQGPPPLIVSVQVGAFPANRITPRAAIVSQIPVKIDEGDIRTKVVGFQQTGIGDIDITKADIIVAIGRGIGEMANIQLAKDVAEALGGVIGCTRPVADAGWLPPEYVVGMSGKTVRPKVYMACGISGATHHTVSMKDSQIIIAINKDPNAPIFQVAHYGVTGDLLEILPAIAQEARALANGRKTV